MVKSGQMIIHSGQSSGMAGVRSLCPGCHERRCENTTDPCAGPAPVSRSRCGVVVLRGCICARVRCHRAGRADRALRQIAVPRGARREARRDRYHMSEECRPLSREVRCRGRLAEPSPSNQPRIVWFSQARFHREAGCREWEQARRRSCDPRGIVPEACLPPCGTW